MPSSPRSRGFSVVAPITTGQIHAASSLALERPWKIEERTQSLAIASHSADPSARTCSSPTRGCAAQAARERRGLARASGGGVQKRSAITQVSSARRGGRPERASRRDARAALPPDPRRGDEPAWGRDRPAELLCGYYLEVNGVSLEPYARTPERRTSSRESRAATRRGSCSLTRDVVRSIRWCNG